MLGSVYFYVILLLVLVVLVGIAIANAIYFADVYNDGSEHLSTTQAQQLIVLNIVVAVLLVLSTFFVLYMMTQTSKLETKNECLEREVLLKQEEFNNKLRDIEETNDDMIRTSQIKKVKKEKKEMMKIIEESKKPDPKLKIKDKKITNLEKEINKLEEKLELVSSLHGDVVSSKENEIENLKKTLVKHQSILDEKDKDIKLRDKIIAARDSNVSVLSEGLFDYDESSLLYNIIPNEILFTDEPSLDYGIDVKSIDNVEEIPTNSDSTFNSDNEINDTNDITNTNVRDDTSNLDNRVEHLIHKEKLDSISENNVNEEPSLNYGVDVKSENKDQDYINRQSSLDYGLNLPKYYEDKPQMDHIYNVKPPYQTHIRGTKTEPLLHNSIKSNGYMPPVLTFKHRKNT